jgi:undecaprenyl phosphate-alpha-L-ara4N flippase subunit ArnE
MSFNNFSLIVFCIITEGISQLCLKHSADGDISFWQTLAKPILWLGILFWAIEIIAWTIVLEAVPLTIAFPVMSMTYVTTILASSLVFKEEINRRHILGTILITAGVACVGATGI